jgi:RNA polymerase sigma-70 factor, ECF subfamily
MGRTVPQPETVGQPGVISPDACLVRAAQDDPSAFAALYDRYFDTMFRFCFYRLRDWQDAEDAASQVFANALANLSGFRAGRHPDGFRCWLFVIARHVVTDRHRDVARHPVAGLEWAAGIRDTAPDPEELAVAADSHRQVLSLLSRLKPAQRDLLELRLAGLKNAEIARILGRSHDAIRKEQSRIVQQLRGLVEDQTAREAANG